MEFEYRSLAPLVLFVYNRPFYTQSVLDSLAKNTEAKESNIYIYCDGPKQGASVDTLSKIEQTRNIAKSENRFKKVTVIEQPENKGLAQSVISGVSEICNVYGSIIVLEDDIVTSPFFLRYMNESLQTYKNIDTVGCISGYWYPTKEKLPETFFLRNFSCWGWATWTRAWNIFEEDGGKILLELREKKLTKQFDLEGSIKYTCMLQDQIAGKNDSWAIRWDAANFVENKLCMYPGVSVVQNIGFDGSGIHSNKTSYYEVCLANKPIKVQLLPVVECTEARNALIQFYKKINRAVFFQRIYNKMFSLFRAVHRLS